MKKMTLVILAMLMIFSTGNAQKTYKATKDITLTFTSDEGTNGSAVVWNSDKKIYYAVIAGNADYPLEAFSRNGKSLFSTPAGIDVRGLWYNPISKNLEGNGSGETGIFSIKLDSRGKPEAAEVLFGGELQPDFQSVGAYDTQNQQIYYFFDGEFYVYDGNLGEIYDIFEMTGCPAELDNLNSNSIIFTDRENEQLGLLDIDKKVYLFNLDGFNTATVELPEDAITNDFFRFSYANGKIWLYDVESRTWSGYSFK